MNSLLVYPALDAGEGCRGGLNLALNSNSSYALQMINYQLTQNSKCHPPKIGYKGYIRIYTFFLNVILSEGLLRRAERRILLMRVTCLGRVSILFFFEKSVKYTIFIFYI